MISRAVILRSRHVNLAIAGKRAKLYVSGRSQHYGGLGTPVKEIKNLMMMRCRERGLVDLPIVFSQSVRAAVEGNNSLDFSN